MATKGKLTNEQMDILQGWIGGGPKMFTLLYAITKDRCNATTFHEKCDNQGPTVTVLYTEQGSVYGGYTSASWNSCNQYVNTSDAFLFQLSYNGCLTANTFMLKPTGRQFSIFCGTRHGPTFGSGDGHDLLTFTNAVNEEGCHFTLNGNMNNFGKSYDAQGTTSEKVNNGSMIVTELEVYKVSYGNRQNKSTELPDGWRKPIKFDNKFPGEIKEKVTFKPRRDLQVNEIRILMLGPVGAGKSSFYNTINSVFCGRITHGAPIGNAKENLSTLYTPYRLKVVPSPNIQFCDTNGMEETNGLTEEELAEVLDGYKPKTSLTAPTDKAAVQLNDRIHCAAFVLDSTTMDTLSPELVGKIRSYQNIIAKRGIPQVIILTKIDRLCTEVGRNAEFALKSKEVETQVEKASQLLGLPRLCVFPVKNYEREIELDENISSLALTALQQILNFTEDVFNNLADGTMSITRGKTPVVEKTGFSFTGMFCRLLKSLVGKSRL